MSNLKRGNPAWKKGVSGNPNGRKQVHPDLLKYDEFNKEEVRRIISKYATISKNELDAIILDSTTHVADLAICTAFRNAIEQGDTSRLEFLFAYSIGKPKEQIDLNIGIKQLSDTELIAGAEEALKVLKSDTIEIEATEVKDGMDTAGPTYPKD